MNNTDNDKMNFTRLEYLPHLFVCLFGIVTNSISILVFTNSQIKEPIFKYMLAISISDLIYCSLLCFESMSLCDTCFSETYFKEFFRLYVLEYFCGCLAIFIILIDLAISTERSMIVVNKECLKKISIKLVLLTFSIISLLYYSPILFSFTIKLKDGTYGFVINDFGRLVGEKIIIGLQSMRIIFSIILIPCINMNSAWRLKRLFKKRSIIRGNSIIGKKFF